MRKTLLNALLLPLFTGVAFTVHAIPPSKATTPPSFSSPSHEQTINLNTASAEILQRELSGIGKAKAEAIIAYRDANGGFQTVDELLEVKGVGSALVERNKNRLTAP
ncbi:ComEA family DNA-binding protein [Pseudomonas sp. SC11]|uniref:ComEA family DNA-binding protein n=1 Tax=Pseudomonas sp. SC11 TaxID=326927 RepID=UPI00399B1B16